MPTVRRASAEDAPFLEEMLAIAVDWRPGARVRCAAEIMSEPGLARCVAGWPADRDVGFVVEDGRPVGATWWRFRPRDDPGYGFFDEATPELSIGIIAEARRQGLGTRLLEALIEEGRRQALPAMSLSVELDNPARALYQRLGFVTAGRVGGAFTMVLRLAG